jgi:hypothetical protein
MSESKSSWLDYEDADHNAMADKWAYTWQVFTGEYSDEENVRRYLQKRAAWEKNEQFDLRINAADPDLLFSTIIGSIVGQLFAVEGDAKRIWQTEGTRGLGDPNDPDTTMGRLWDNADGEGTAWPVLWRSFATRLLVFQWMYVLVDGMDAVTFEDEDGSEEIVTGEARIKLIDPAHVLARGYEGGRMVWAKVKHVVVTGDDDPRQEQKEEEQYTLYTLEGWQRYRKVKAGDKTAEELIGEGSYEFYETNDRQARCLPLFLVKFPFPTYIAHYLARKAVVIFNHESVRDTFLTEGTTVHLIEYGDPMQYESHRDDMNAGETHHQFSPASKAEYIAPPDGPARLTSDVLEDKRKNLYISAYQTYADAASQATATEIRQDARGGIEAFLSLFSASVEEAQNRATVLLEQIYFPTTPDLWGGAKVELSTDFVPADPTALDAALVATFFGPAAVPVDAETLTAAAARIIERKGFQITPEQRAALRAIYDAYVSKRDGSGPRIAENRARLNEMAATLIGAPAAAN